MLFFLSLFSYSLCRWRCSSKLCFSYPSFCFIWCSNCITDFDFSSNNQYIASSSMDKTVRVWDVSKGHCMRIIYGVSPQLCIRFHPVRPLFIFFNSLLFFGKSQEFCLFLALFILTNRNNRINTTRVRIYMLSFITSWSSQIIECDKVTHNPS